MIWFIQDLDRARQEREGIEDLAVAAGWLTIVGWRIDDRLRLIVEADIAAGGRAYPISMRYPAHFPHGPPVVLPRGEETRWSGHQYGAGGELCLEWRPDNWQPERTGADMFRSAFALLEGERPSGAAPAQVTSAHATTLGQDVRGTYSRLVATAALREQLRLLAEGVAWSGTLTGVFHKEAAGLAVSTLTFANGDIWTDATVPADLGDEGSKRPVTVLRVAPASPLPSTANAVAFVGFFATFGLTLPDSGYALVLRGSEISGYFVWQEQNSAVMIRVIEPEYPRSRLDMAHQALAEHKVAVVGCGSLGSKIAASLARCGVGEFLLVDDDILLPGNLVRNDLDWRDIGTHKADSVARRIQMVNPAAKCQRRKHRLGGQESGESFESAIVSIARCDLIIDATADPRVFNLLCAAVAHGGKSFVWAEVFGGGIGGLMARYRPGREPDPATARAMIEQWCADRRNPVQHATVDYETRAAVPLIADDADVSVIAGHVTRFAIDTLLARDPSMFPVSAYMIGLAKGWEFGGPFETFPIDLGSQTVDVERPVADPDKANAELQRILALLKGPDDEAASAAQDPSAASA